MIVTIPRIERNIILQKVFCKLTREKGMSLKTLGEFFKVDKTSVAPLFREKSVGKIKTETFISYLHRLGCKIRFTAQYTEQSIDGSTFDYSDDHGQLNKWVADTVRRYLNVSDMSIPEASDKLGASKFRLYPYLASNATLQMAPISGMELFSGLGIVFTLEIEHPAESLTEIIPAKPVGRVHKYIESKPKDNIREDDSFLGIVSVEMLVKMGRGQVKTSLGEVVRPFL